MASRMFMKDVNLMCLATQLERMCCGTIDVSSNLYFALGLAF